MCLTAVLRMVVQCTALLAGVACVVKQFVYLPNLSLMNSSAFSFTVSIISLPLSVLINSVAFSTTSFTFSFSMSPAALSLRSSNIGLSFRGLLCIYGITFQVVGTFTGGWVKVGGTGSMSGRFPYMIVFGVLTAFCGIITLFLLIFA